MTIKLPDTIKFILTDFDGVCTDNCVYIDPKGEMSRKVNFKDIMAFSLIKKNGLKVGIISGETNSAIEKLNEVFKLDEVHQGIRVKLDIVKNIVEKYNLKPDEYLFIGDDVNDYDTLCYVKHRLTVPNAVKKIKSIEGIQLTESYGGDGAFREIVDAVLKVD